jgi:hypothetical protein
VVQKPIIGILVDQSQSIALQPQGQTYTQEIPEKIRTIQEKLEGNFEVKTFSFSNELADSLSPRWSGNASNLGKALEQFQEKLEGQNVGALLMVSDGIVNQGKNPWYVAQQLPYPIFPLALGDTTPQKDLAIQSIKHNEIVLKGNEFQSVFSISAKALSGKTASYSLQKITNDNQPSPVKTGNFPIQQDQFQTNISVQLPANEAGLLHYRLTLATVGGEKNTQNNTKDFFVEVIDDRARILLLASAPHPDVATVRQILSQKQSMEVVVKNPESGNINLSNFDAVICFQLPSINGNDQIVQQIRQSQLPVWYIGGNQTAYSRLNAPFSDFLKNAPNAFHISRLFKCLTAIIPSKEMQRFFSNNKLNWFPLPCRFSPTEISKAFDRPFWWAKEFGNGTSTNTNNLAITPR